MSHKVYYGLPKEVVFCKKTLMSNQKPNSAVEFTHNKNSKNLNPEEYELVSKIARGLVFQATTDPHSTFLMGVKGFKNDKDKKRDLKKKETKKEQNNVIDFIDYLKRLRDK